MTKAELRKIYIDKQRNLDGAERKRKNERVAANFFQNFDSSEINFLHCFIAIEKFGEVDTSLIFKRIWKGFPKVETIVPRVDFQTGEIENPRLTPAAKLVENRWGVSEPDGVETIETKAIDVCLIPLLCFDRQGSRVGYGKGFYDRFLIDCRHDCLKIGLSYFAPVTEISDAQDFDVKLDYCITPEKIFDFK